MQAIINGFNSLMESLGMFGQFLKTTVGSLLELINLLTTIPTNLGILIGGLPPWLMAVATTTLGVSVLYMVIGRSTGK